MTNNKKEVQRKADAKRAGQRARAWTAIVYPDSENTPDNWKEILSEQLVECLISPLHDKDVEPTGEIKKAHYHVVLSFKNPTAFDKAMEVFKAVGAVVPPEHQSKVKDFKQMARYLCHLDQPNKHRYDVNDVISFGAIDYAAFVRTAADEDEVLDEVEEFILTHRIISFISFCNYCRRYRRDWLYFVRHKYGFHIREFIKANSWDIYNSSLIAQTEDWTDSEMEGQVTYVYLCQSCGKRFENEEDRDNCKCKVVKPNV